MHDAYTPIVFQRHNHQLRAAMVDNQPWFVAMDFARMIGALKPGRPAPPGGPAPATRRPLAARQRW